MKPPYPSLTAEWHNDTYDAICPSRPPLSVANKNVIVTGAGAGIGRESVKAYAMAGAAHISLLGRTLATLTQTKNIIETEFPSVRSSIYTVDVTDEAAMKKAAEGVGQWDILVLNAGITMKPSSIEHASVTEWWRVLETNVKGPMVAAHAFLPTRKNAAAIISVSAALVNLPASIPPSKGSSAYISSKMAQLKLLEHLAAENPDVFVISVHPGVVETNMMDIQEAKGMKVPLDNVKLPAHFFVWASSPEAKFLRGKFVYANWDVDELKARAKEIEETPILTANVLGWPFTPEVRL